MNNPFRARLQSGYIASLLRRLGGPGTVRRALEVGCGRGEALALLARTFGAADAVGLDLDLRMLALARRRHPEARLVLADAARMPFRDGAFDAVFDFGALHIVAEWRRALDEVRRVLTPGGGYYFEWVTGRGLRALYALAAERFETMTVPTPHDLLDALERRGLHTEGRVARPRLISALTCLVGNIIGVGRLTA